MTAATGIDEGLWFGVPLRTSGFGLGVVARINPRAALLGYFFGPARDQPPSLADSVGLTADDAVYVTRFGHLGLTGGSWPQLGTRGDWDREKWPTPRFVRYEELTGRTLLVTYDDADPSRLLSEEQVRPGIAEQGPQDGLAGAGYVEKWLTELLRP